MHRFLPTCRRPSARTLTKLYNERPSWLAQAHAALDAAVAAAQQAPFAVVLGCIDSRVPPELIFDQNIGDLFVARVAGNIASSDIVGSLEFAAALAGAKLIVVFGHSECGAVKGAIDVQLEGDLDLKGTVGLGCALKELGNVGSVVADSTTRLQASAAGAVEVTGAVAG